MLELQFTHSPLFAAELLGSTPGLFLPWRAPPIELCSIELCSNLALSFASQRDDNVIVPITRRQQPLELTNQLMRSVRSGIPYNVYCA